MIRVYIYRGGWASQLSNSAAHTAYVAAFTQAIHKWGERVRFHQGAAWNVVLDLWLEFDTEEEAALFKLSEL